MDEADYVSCAPNEARPKARLSTRQSETCMQRPNDQADCEEKRDPGGMITTGQTENLELDADDRIEKRTQAVFDVPNRSISSETGSGLRP